MEIEDHKDIDIEGLSKTADGYVCRDGQWCHHTERILMVKIRCSSGLRDHRFLQKKNEITELLLHFLTHVLLRKKKILQHWLRLKSHTFHKR